MWITFFLINIPPYEFTSKRAENRLFVDKKSTKKGVIHNISTKCGYMDSNNVEMWTSWNAPISC